MMLICDHLSYTGTFGKKSMRVPGEAQLANSSKCSVENIGASGIIQLCMCVLCSPMVIRFRIC